MNTLPIELRRKVASYIYCVVFRDGKFKFISKISINEQHNQLLTTYCNIKPIRGFYMGESVRGCKMWILLSNKTFIYDFYYTPDNNLQCMFKTLWSHGDDYKFSTYILDIHNKWQKTVLYTM